MSGFWVETLSAIRPDPDWWEIDEHGHVHRWDGSNIPTAERKATPDYSVNVGTDDEPMMEGYPGDDWWECRECGAVLSPRMVDCGPSRRWIAGRREAPNDPKEPS